MGDCDKNGSDGCNGGDMATAFQWGETQNIATESSYPYTATDGTCKTSFTTAIPSGGITGYKNVDQSTDALKSAINVGPVSVAIEADQILSSCTLAAFWRTLVACSAHAVPTLTMASSLSATAPITSR